MALRPGDPESMLRAGQVPLRSLCRFGGISIVAEVLSGDVVAEELSKLLPASAVRLDVAAADWRAAVRAAGDALVASGATTDQYTDEMISTVETLGPYIVIAPGIALAHSRPSPSVIRAGLCMVRLAAPVEFGHRQNDPVRLVVGLASPDDQGHVKALATLAEFLADDGRQAALLEAPDVGTVRQLIRRYELEPGAA
jgi:PTS system ascorbate-specific IIA component